MRDWVRVAPIEDLGEANGDNSLVACFLLSKNIGRVDVPDSGCRCIPTYILQL